MSTDQKNQGEGNRAADRRYREDAEEFIESGKVSGAAEKARDARESGEKEKLNKAEKAGMKPARH
jgi:hypothetical protein